MRRPEEWGWGPALGRAVPTVLPTGVRASVWGSPQPMLTSGSCTVGSTAPREDWLGEQEAAH